MSENISIYEITSDDLKWIVENSNMPVDFKKTAEHEYERRTSLGEVLNHVCKCKSQV
jgi:hypothetical protein